MYVTADIDGWQKVIDVDVNAINRGWIKVMIPPSFTPLTQRSDINTQNDYVQSVILCFDHKRKIFKLK